MSLYLLLLLVSLICLIKSHFIASCRKPRTEQLAEEFGNACERAHKLIGSSGTLDMPSAIDNPTAWRRLRAAFCSHSNFRQPISLLTSLSSQKPNILTCWTPLDNILASIVKKAFNFPQVVHKFHEKLLGIVCTLRWLLFLQESDCRVNNAGEDAMLSAKTRSIIKLNSSAINYNWESFSLTHRKIIFSLDWKNSSSALITQTAPSLVAPFYCGRMRRKSQLSSRARKWTKIPQIVPQTVNKKQFRTRPANFVWDPRWTFN